MTVNKMTTWKYKYRKLNKAEKDQIRFCLEQDDDNKEKIAQDFKCSLKKIDGISARLFHADSWSS